MSHNLVLSVGQVTGKKGRQSLEEFWRNERYSFLNKLNHNFIITCHHLDDCVETWLMSSIHGKPKLIPYQRNTVYRPFLMTTKSRIRDYATRKNILHVEDPSNTHTNLIRNHIRHNMMPHVLKVNPGIRTMVRKKMIELYRNI